VGRFSACHFDIPMRGCTIQLDDEIVVSKGVLQGELALDFQATLRAQLA
jgi:2,5-dihydroxypyridine 5,6-dioxygenase